LYCAWIEDDAGQNADVWAAWFLPDGKMQAPAQRLASAGKTTWNLNAAIEPSAAAIVVFDATAGTRSDELFLAQWTGPGVVDVRRLTADDGIPSKYPDIALGGGQAALTWFDERDGNKEVYFLVHSMSGLNDAVTASAARITNTPGESIGAYVAWNGSRFGLAWCDDLEGQQEIYYQSFTPSGNSEGDARRLTFSPQASSIPAIKPNGNGFALAWNEYAAAPPGGNAATSEIHFTVTP